MVHDNKLVEKNNGVVPSMMKSDDRSWVYDPKKKNLGFTDNQYKLYIEASKKKRPVSTSSTSAYVHEYHLNTS